MCKFAGFIAFVVIGFVGGIGIGIPTKLLLAFAILNVMFIFLLFLFRWIAEYAENIQWRICYIEKINIPCVFGFLKDNEYQTWTVEVTTYQNGRVIDQHEEQRNNAWIVWTIDFFIGLLLGLCCPALLFYLLIWYVYCITTSIMLYRSRDNKIHPGMNITNDRL